MCSQNLNPKYVPIKNSENYFYLRLFLLFLMTNWVLIGMVWGKICIDHFTTFVICDLALTFQHILT